VCFGVVLCGLTALLETASEQRAARQQNESDKRHQPRSHALGSDGLLASENHKRRAGRNET